MTSADLLRWHDVLGLAAHRCERSGLHLPAAALRIASRLLWSVWAECVRWDQRVARVEHVEAVTDCAVNAPGGRA